jgi:hypothetical protein
MPTWGPFSLRIEPQPLIKDFAQSFFCLPSAQYGSAMRHVLVGIMLVAVGTSVPTAASETSEFLQLSDDHQATYVEGILQGMSYVMLNYDRAGFEKWDACVRTQSLEATVSTCSGCSKKIPTRTAIQCRGRLPGQ